MYRVHTDTRVTSRLSFVERFVGVSFTAVINSLALKIMTFRPCMYAHLIIIEAGIYYYSLVIDQHFVLCRSYTQNWQKTLANLNCQFAEPVSVAPGKLEILNHN